MLATRGNRSWTEYDIHEAALLNELRDDSICPDCLVTHVSSLSFLRDRAPTSSGLPRKLLRSRRVSKELDLKLIDDSETGSAYPCPCADMTPPPPPSSTVCESVPVPLPRIDSSTSATSATMLPATPDRLWGEASNEASNSGSHAEGTCACAYEGVCVGAFANEQTGSTSAPTRATPTRATGTTIHPEPLAVADWSLADVPWRLVLSLGVSLLWQAGGKSSGGMPSS